MAAPPTITPPLISAIRITVSVGNQSPEDCTDTDSAVDEGTDAAVLPAIPADDDDDVGMAAAVDEETTDTVLPVDDAGAPVPVPAPVPCPVEEDTDGAMNRLAGVSNAGATPGNGWSVTRLPFGSVTTVVLPCIVDNTCEWSVSLKRNRSNISAGLKPTISDVELDG